LQQQQEGRKEGVGEGKAGGRGWHGRRRQVGGKGKEEESAFSLILCVGWVWCEEWVWVW